MGLNYPLGMNKQHANQTLSQAVKKHGNRGMVLEDLINRTNEYYLFKSKAVIHKKPTPIQIVQVDYPKRSAATITEAYFRHSSTTDYNGIYRGYYIDFEAKETKNKTSFPLKNLHDHQLQHMQACAKHGGICFILFYFSTIQEYYLLEIQQLQKLLAEVDANKKASIALEQIRHVGYAIVPSALATLDYLAVVDQIIKKMEGESDDNSTK